jgi:FAD dependent oxidoreductase TIGR03364
MTGTHTHQADIAVIGAGIVGLAAARAAAALGHRVVVFEREHRAVGASIRNFGMVWPVGQPAGERLEIALESRRIWQDMAARTGFWHTENGSLCLAYQQDEWALLEEFAATAPAQGYTCALYTPAQVAAICPAARLDGLIGALWSATEMIVDPREVPGKLTAWLEAQGVIFRFGTAVRDVTGRIIQTPTETWQVGQVYICSGTDLETLFPEVLTQAGIVKVKLQMMRTAPQPDQWRMGPSIYGGLTLQHYGSFAACAALPALKARIQAASPWFNEWGIHVMMSQNGLGELVIGDSHEYGPTHDPFLREDINQYILDYLHQIGQAPDLRIVERWYGVYAKLPDQAIFIHEAAPGITLVTGIGGAGMTMSFGLMARLLAKL